MPGKRYGRSLPARVAWNLAAAAGSLSDRVRSSIPYVGLPFNGNIGDEVLFRVAERHLRPRRMHPHWARRGRYLPVATGRTHRYLIGGGSLLFDRYTLEDCERLSAAGLVPATFGTGVTNTPADRGELDRWKAVLERADPIGIRGPVTQEALNGLGIRSEVVGDLGYMVNLHIAEPEPSDDSLLVNVRAIADPALGAADRGVRDLLASVVRRYVEQGRKVNLLSVSTPDHDAAARWAGEISPVVEVIRYRGDPSASERLIRSAGALLSMRMHPGIFAAAWGVPSVLIDARHKYVDSLIPAGEGAPELLDPASVASDEIIASVDRCLSEGPGARSRRFGLMRELATRQALYCVRLREDLARPAPLPIP